MTSRRIRCTRALVVVVSLAGGCTLEGGQSVSDDESSDVDAEGGAALESLVTQAAHAFCGAATRCCTDLEGQSAVFAAITTSDPDGRYADLIPRLPPHAPLGAASCPEIVEEIFVRGFLGSWVAAALAGSVEFDPAGARACLVALDAAACGAPASAALLDSTCFAFAAPAGGAEQRSMFLRTATTGSCDPIIDGFGGMLYGTCDPTAAFCCVPSSEGGCILAGEQEQGSCIAVAGEGEACAMFPDVTLCATGVECDASSSTCAAPATSPLAVGDPCYDDVGYRLLGVCEDSWCDVLGTTRCEALRGLGASCTSAEECATGSCVAGACSESALCGG